MIGSRPRSRARLRVPTRYAPHGSRLPEPGRVHAGRRAPGAHACSREATAARLPCLAAGRGGVAPTRPAVQAGPMNWGAVRSPVRSREPRASGRRPSSRARSRGQALPAGRPSRCRARVSSHFAPRFPGRKAARAIHARAWRSGPSLARPRPCCRGPSGVGTGARLRRAAGAGGSGFGVAVAWGCVVFGSLAVLRAVVRFAFRFGAVRARSRVSASGWARVAFVFPSRRRAARFASSALWGAWRLGPWFGGRCLAVRGCVVVVRLPG